MKPTEMELTESQRKHLAHQQLIGAPQPGDVYAHYKGGLYSIVCCSIKEDTLWPMVTYHSNRRGTNWTRTLANFTEEIVIDGRRVPRFARVNEEE